MRVDDLIGARFSVHGRSLKDGFDCYGLAIEVSRRYGHELPDLEYMKSDEYTMNTNYESVLTKLGDEIKKIPCEDVSEGDLLLFQDAKGRSTHIGVCLGNGRFIHCDIGGVRVSRIEYYGRKFGAYRWQK